MKIQNNEIVRIGKDLYGAIYYVLNNAPNYTKIMTERDILIEDIITFGYYDRPSVERCVTEIILYEI